MGLDTPTESVCSGVSSGLFTHTAHSQHPGGQRALRMHTDSPRNNSGLGVEGNASFGFWNYPWARKAFLLRSKSHLQCRSYRRGEKPPHKANRGFHYWISNTWERPTEPAGSGSPGQPAWLSRAHPEPPCAVQGWLRVAPSGSRACWAQRWHLSTVRSRGTSESWISGSRECGAQPARGIAPQIRFWELMCSSLLALSP